MPAISVVIPVYNAAPFLREALDSLLAQTCGDFEAIAVNDGSTDNSLEILQEYAARDSRIRILDGPNGGYGKAMNRGMDAATGKYMAILEPDDFLPREAYATLLPLAERHALDVVRGAYCTFYEVDGERYCEYRPHATDAEKVLFPRKDACGLLNSAAPTWSCLYSLAFLNQHHIRYSESPGASYQDTGMYMKTAVYAERYMLTPEPVYMYRVDNPASSVKAIDNKCFAMMEEYDSIRGALMQTSEIWAEVEPLFWRCFLGSQVWVLSLLSDAKKESFLEVLCEKVERLMQDALIRDEERGLWEKVLAAGSAQRRCSLLLPGGPDHTRTRNICSLGFLRIQQQMSDLYTAFCVMSVPLVWRRRFPVKRRLRPGLFMGRGMKDVFYLLGLPVWRSKRETCDYARVEQSLLRGI